MPISASKILGWHLKKPFPNYAKLYSSDEYTCYWLVEVEDRKPSDPVLIFCHGGGYVFPLSLPQIWLLSKIVREFPNVRLSVLIMDYSLSPEHRYPKQIHEICALYHNLVDVEGCDNIILAGESCGGNLILALLGHLKHGFPTASQITSKAKLSAIKAVILVSPWVNLAVEKVVTDENSSYVRNAKEDILTTERLHFWAGEYCPDHLTRQTPWVSPVKVGEDNLDFWDNLFPKETLVTWGEDELMRDDCSKWANEIVKLTNVLEVPSGVHVDVLFDSKSPSLGKIMELLKSLFEGEGEREGTESNDN